MKIATFDAAVGRPPPLLAMVSRKGHSTILPSRYGDGKVWKVVLSMKTSTLVAFIATAGITLTQPVRANPPGRGGSSGAVPHFSSSAHFARPAHSYVPVNHSQQTVRYVHPSVQVGSHLPPRSWATNSAPQQTAPTTAAARNAQTQNKRISFAEATRRYSHARHDRNWWESHYSEFVLENGGYYYWDSGYWCPAWGYDPSFEAYSYDGPIYGYDNLNPDQVVADVQAQLQQDGYYNGPTLGILDPPTQAAIASYQRDHNLSITSVVDAATIKSLGLT
jgi:Putative peptidoglycan binding domain